MVPFSAASASPPRNVTRWRNLVAWRPMRDRFTRSEKVPEGEVEVQRPLLGRADVHPHDELAVPDAQASPGSAVEREKLSVGAVELPHAPGVDERDEAERNGAVEEMRVGDAD